jgi:hypothetical protein
LEQPTITAAVAKLSPAAHCRTVRDSEFPARARPASSRCGAGGRRSCRPARQHSLWRRRTARSSPCRPARQHSLWRRRTAPRRSSPCRPARGPAAGGPLPGRPMSDSASDKFPSATQLRWTGQDGSTRCGDRSAQPRSARPALCAQLMSAQGRRTSYGSSC